MDELKGMYKENGRELRSKKETGSVNTISLRCSRCEYITFVASDIEFGDEGRCPECGAQLVENNN